MAAPRHLQSLKEEATCSVCLDYFTDPVAVACGHTFCLSCVTRCWEGLQTDFPCPQCRAISETKTLRPNRKLVNVVEIAKQLQAPSATPQEANLCRKHEEKLKLFCEDDQEPICVVCSVSHAHKQHMVVPILEAAQEHKEKFQSYLEELKKKLADILELQHKEEIKVIQLKDKFKSQREQSSNEYEEMQQFLDKQKTLYLSDLNEKEKKSLQSIKEKANKLQEEQISIRNLIAEVESKYQQQDVEFLKDVKNTPIRHIDFESFGENEEKAATEEEVDLQMKILQSLAWRWSRSFAREVTLDPDTAQRWLILSKDGRSVRNGHRAQNLPNIPQRFTKYPIVLGRERLSSGMHYWEVEVGDKTEWGLGVCDECVSRKRRTSVSPEDGFWAVSLRDGEYRALTFPTTPLTTSVSPRVLGLFLDYEAGKLSVYNVDDKSLLFTFSGASFSTTVRPYFNPGPTDGGKNEGALQILPVNGQQ
ncbi:E3 ubiquitin-protein ligase TRIM39-like [Pleurodeles waltl]|uniref:E3 ubiquitin-protein ligase TRIM39-like n=1 Tax=Pleurodeles waltl TaxID=8319 RepID=UPI0037098E51